MSERLLAGLNPAQREAVLHGPGPLLVLAGAGSGKTRVLTHRVAYLIEHWEVDPSHVLAVTFTNKAAGEMKERVMRLLAERPGGIQGLWIGTFHSVCARVLRRIAERIGYPRAFTIYDADDSLQLIKTVMDAMSWSIAAVDAYGLRRRISDAKNRLLSPDEYAALNRGHVEDAVAEAYRRYQALLAANKAFDFDDLLMRTVIAMREDPGLLGSLRRRFRHVLVDEYQDTNHAQYQLVKLLTEEHRNVCVVGDDDQSIYGWRGADIANILSFEDDFPEAVAIRLEQNYRSTKKILDAAHAIVEKNRQRKPKKLWTEREDGEPLQVWGAADGESEAVWIARTVQALQRDGHAASDLAILYRTNAQSRALEEGFRRRGIPYVLIGGTRFYERLEIKDAIAYLRILANPADDWSLTRALGVPKRGVGPVTLRTMEEVAHERGVPLSGTLRDPSLWLQVHAPVQASLGALADLLDAFRDRAAREPAGAWVAEYLERTGLFAYYRALNDPRREERLENLHELVAGVQAFSDERAAPGEGDLDGFLEEVSLLTDIDQAANLGGAVTLMTLHNAKGLEFPVVFLSGCEEGLFPLARSIESPREYEEERRLFYVGLTRAQNRVYLSYAHERYRWGQTTIAGPSPFLLELPTDLVEWEEEPLSGWPSWSRAGRGAAPRNGPARPPWSGTSHGAAAWDTIATDDPPGDSVEPEEVSDLAPSYRAGERVVHREFGAGTIRSVSGTGRDVKLVVRFDRWGDKKLVARFARLEKEW